MVICIFCQFSSSKEVVRPIFMILAVRMVLPLTRVRYCLKLFFLNFCLYTIFPSVALYFLFSILSVKILNMMVKYGLNFQLVVCGLLFENLAKFSMKHIIFAPRICQFGDTLTPFHMHKQIHLFASGFFMKSISDFFHT
jgi:hypothetical protein